VRCRPAGTAIVFRHNPANRQADLQISLAFLRAIVRHGGMPRRRPPKQPPPPLTVAEVLTWADAHRARTGSWPSAYAKRIPEAPLGTNWRQVDNGLRGLPGKSSLAQVLADHRGHRNIRALPRLTVAAILRWADAWKLRTGKSPLIYSGAIPEATNGDTWHFIDLALRSGARGLRPGSSLPQLLAQRRRVRNFPGTPPLTIETIFQWADEYHKEIGLWPTAMAGPIAGQPGETWGTVNAALDGGKRGLRGHSSLAKLLRKHRGVINRPGIGWRPA
jgi:hypothetical protein